MADRILLCIDPDAATVAEVRRVFSPHGLRVESISNGEQAIEWARANKPVLIILSVEPRKVGYAICNKLKRSPTLREVPLILISGEETMATFEQHKRLKSRAEEYMLKPLDRAALVAKVNRLIDLGRGGTETANAADQDIEEIELADDELAEVSLDEEEGLVDEGFGANDNRTIATDAVGLPGTDVVSEGVPSTSDSLKMLGDLSRPTGMDPNAPSPFHELAGGTAAAGAPVHFDAEQFDQETQAAFAALESGSVEGGTPAPDMLGAGGAGRAAARAPTGGMEDLRSVWSDADLPARMPWEEPAGSVARSATNRGGSSGAQDLSGAATPPPHVAAAEAGDDSLLAGIGSEVPPLPEEVLYDERQSADTAARDRRIGELEAHLAKLQARVDAADTEKRGSEVRATELQGRIASLETERQTLRKELDEQREHMTQVASQGAFSKERDLLNLREIINRKEKDVLDLRDGLDAKERLILDHKDKIRELERARRDLEERTLGFEKSLVAANEKVQELTQDKEKSVEREKGLKARLDDAHEELRKGQDEIEAVRKRGVQEVERARADGEKTRAELEAKIADIEESRRSSLAKAADDWATAEAAEKAAHETELARLETAHRLEVDGLQKRLVDDAAAASERLQTELLKLRRDNEKAIAALKEEQALQLASERQAYETQTEAKHRAHREEVMALRRRHEEELTAAEDRRQRDILEQEQRRVAELEMAENRRRVELQSRDEDHHLRVTEAERRHLIEKTEMAERHRTEHDQAVGRAARAEGELAARAQEIEQAYRRLAGFEADLDAARAELGDRDVRLGQARDRLSELETKVGDYEDQIVRAFQRLRADEKTTEKIRRALGVALALLDERAVAAQSGLKPIPASDEAEKS
jgi:CheY-like chemotaxis protein